MKLHHLGTTLLIGVAALTAACGSDSESGSGQGTFPSFYSLAKSAMPTVSSTGSIVVSEGKVADAQAIGILAASPMTSTYSTSTSDFSDAFASSQNYFGQVFLDAGTTGTVKSIFTLLAQADATFTDINQNYSDSSGAPTNCTAIASTTNLTTPFFATATTAAFNAWSDSGKYNCYFTSSSGTITAFGRHAIASPSAGCTDAYEYYVFTGYSKQGEANSEQVSERGTSKDLSSVSRYYYNGCTKDVKIAYVQSTQYSGGVEFSSRSEITANTSTNEFTTRLNFIDRASGYFTHSSFVASGVGKKTASSTTPAYFIAGYRPQTCTGTASTATCTTTSGAERTFCVKNDSTGSSFALETTSSNCSSYNTTYTGLNVLEVSDLNRGYIAISTSTLGI